MKSEKKPKTLLHLRLTTEDWVECFRELTRAELGVLYYIRTKDPYGDRNLEIDCGKVGESLLIHRTSVSRALYALVQKGFLDSKYGQAASRDNIEHQIRDTALARRQLAYRLQSELGGQTEVITAVGRIDLLTSTEVIEIKNIDDCSEALGKILAYAAFFPNHNKRIHLFGKPDLTKLSRFSATCSEFGVALLIEEVR